MVRATLAKVQIAMLGANPPGVTDAAITNLCARVDYKLDSITHPDDLSTSDNLVIEIAVDMVLLEIEYALWLQAGGALSGKNKPTLMPNSLLRRIENLSTGTDDHANLDLIEV